MRQNCKAPLCQHATCARGHGPGVSKKGLERVLETELEWRELMDAGPSMGKGKKENMKGSGAKGKSSKG